MLKEIIRTAFVNKNNATFTKVIGLYQCDFCKIEFKRQFCRTVNTKFLYHFCSRQCIYKSKKGNGILAIKTKKTWVEKYGVENPSQSEEIKLKKRETTLKHFGVDNPFKVKEIHARCQTLEANKKRHETLKKNGSYGKSKMEDEFFIYLSQRFETVQRQIKINGWAIDFYLPNEHTYVQFDGIYWHGLNRPIEEIISSTTARDKAIYRTWLRDRKQEIWFFEHNLKLLRITDFQFKQNLPI